jgi:hypothetical protein
MLIVLKCIKMGTNVFFHFGDASIVSKNPQIFGARYQKYIHELAGGKLFTTIIPRFYRSICIFYAFK